MSNDEALGILKKHIECYDRENEGCDYDCEKCGLDISHEELVNAIRVIVDL